MLFILKRKLENTYLLEDSLTITDDEAIVADLKKVCKKGKYNKTDFDILNHIVKFDNAYEYVYVDSNKKIRSKLIQPENAHPIYNDEIEMITFILTRI